MSELNALSIERLDAETIQRLRQLDQTEKLEDGSEAVRVTAQFGGRPTTRDRAAWRDLLLKRSQEFGQEVRRYGGKVVDGTLSVSGQTVEAVVPVENFSNAVKGLQAHGIQLKLLQNYEVDPGY